MRRPAASAPAHSRRTSAIERRYARSRNVEVGERGDEPVDVAGAELLPRQLVDDPRPERLRPRTQRASTAWAAARRAVGGEVAVLDGLAVGVGGEGEAGRSG